MNNAFLKLCALLPFLVFSIAISAGNDAEKEWKEMTSRLDGQFTLVCVKEAAPALEAFAAEICAANPAIRLKIQVLPSEQELWQALESGRAALALSDSPKPELLRTFTTTPLLVKGLTIVVNDVSPTNGITLSQFKNLLTGRPGKWGSASKEWRPYIIIPDEFKAPEAAATFGHSASCDCDACQKARRKKEFRTGQTGSPSPELAMSKERALSIVIQDVSAATLYDITEADGLPKGVKSLTIDGAKPDFSSIVAGSYPLGQVFFMVVPQNADEKTRNLAKALNCETFLKTLQPLGFAHSQSGNGK